MSIRMNHRQHFGISGTWGGFFCGGEFRYVVGDTNGTPLLWAMKT